MRSRIKSGCAGEGDRFGHWGRRLPGDGQGPALLLSNRVDGARCSTYTSPIFEKRGVCVSGATCCRRLTTPYIIYRTCYRDLCRAGLHACCSPPAMFSSASHGGLVHSLMQQTNMAHTVCVSLDHCLKATTLVNLFGNATDGADQPYRTREGGLINVGLGTWGPVAIVIASVLSIPG
jgi:hypothetical protein